MTEGELRERARSLFLDDANLFGCAETTVMTLAAAFDLPESAVSSEAMALNGGVAYSGEVCGALTGAAMAAGLVASRLEPDRAAAKRNARRATAQLIREFQAEFGAVRCRDLIGMDLSTPEKHDAFIAGGLWRTVCMRQIEFAVGRLPSLINDPADRPASARGVRCSSE
jgi:C_GCAxxG_C_C family probable redox protein